MAWRLRRAAASIKTDPVILQAVLHLHGAGGVGAMLLLLAAPCLMPISGVGALLGPGLAALAWANWRGRVPVELPSRVSGVALRRTWARRVLALSARLCAAVSGVPGWRWPGVAAAAMGRAALLFPVGLVRASWHLGADAARLFRLG